MVAVFARCEQISGSASHPELCSTSSAADQKAATAHTHCCERTGKRNGWMMHRRRVPRCLHRCLHCIDQCLPQTPPCKHSLHENGPNRPDLTSECLPNVYLKLTNSAWFSIFLKVASGKAVHQESILDDTHVVSIFQNEDLSLCFTEGFSVPFSMSGCRKKTFEASTGAFKWKHRLGRKVAGVNPSYPPEQWSRAVSG